LTGPPWDDPHAGSAGVMGEWRKPARGNGPECSAPRWRWGGTPRPAASDDRRSAHRCGRASCRPRRQEPHCARDERHVRGITRRVAATDERITQRRGIAMELFDPVGPRPDDEAFRLPAFRTVRFDQVAQQRPERGTGITRGAVYTSRPGRLHLLGAATTRIPVPPARTVLAFSLYADRTRGLPAHAAPSGRVSNESQAVRCAFVSNFRALHQPRTASKNAQLAHVMDGTGTPSAHGMPARSCSSSGWTGEPLDS